MIKRITAAAKVLVPLVVAFFIGRVIYGNWQQVREAEWAFAPVYIFLSVVVTAFWFVVRPWVWKLILAQFGYSLPYGAAYGIFRRAELSRFVPGSIWHYVSRVYLAGQWGVPATACLAATLTETVILLLAAIVPALWSLHQALPFLAAPQRVLLLVVPFVALGLMHPKVLNFGGRFLARRLKQPYVELRVGWARLAGIWLLYVMIWVTHGLSAGLFVRGILEVPVSLIPMLGSSYILAWLIGMVSLIAPAGMGVRDGAFGLLLRGVMPLGAALTVAVAVRLWSVSIELLYTMGVGRFIHSPAPGASEAASGNRL